MKHRRITVKESSSQDLRGISILSAPPSVVPASVEITLFSCILLFLFFGGTIGCLVTGFSIPIYASVLCFGIPALTVLLLLCDRLLARTPILYLLPFVTLSLYLWQRMDVLLDGFCYIAAVIMRYLCHGFPGLAMPQLLTEHEQFLIHAETNDLLLTSIRAPITECLLAFCVGLGFVWIFLYQHNQSAWLSAALPLPVFILCFLIIETTLPALWALSLILLYWILILFTRTTLHLHIRAAATQTLCLILPCILFLSAVYLCYPRETSVGQLVQRGYDKVLNAFSVIETTVSDAAGNLFSGGWFTVSAEGSEISFENLGPRRFFGRTVMRAKSDTPGIIYLRENTYGTYTSDGWEQTALDGVTERDSAPHIQLTSSWILKAEGFEPSRLSLDGARSPLLFTPYYFSDATVDYAFVGDGRIENPKRKTDYHVSFYRFPGDFSTLQYETPASAAAMVQLYAYMKDAVPVYQTIDPALAEELRGILANADITPTDFTESFVFDSNGSIRIVTDFDAMWDLIADITYFVRGAAEYSLNAPKNTSDRDFVLWFLEDAEYGYCTHFATAEVMLLRACGIPARLASGFLGNIRASDSWTANKDSNAHAWVEVFDVRLGWIPVEATPPGTASDGVNPDDIIVGVTPIPSSDNTVPDTEDTSEADETTEPAVTEPISEGSASTETASLTETQPEPPTTTLPTETADIGTDVGGTVDMTRLLHGIGKAVAIVICIGAILAIPLLLRYTRKKRITALLSPEDDERNVCALRLYRRCVSLARACGEDIPAALTVLAEKARFSQHVLSEQEMHLMTAWYQSKCCQLQKQDKPLDRLRHSWIDVFY